MKCVGDEVSSNALEALEDGDFRGDLGVSLYLSSTCGSLFVELFEEFWGIEVTVVNPAVISGWVSFLFHHRGRSNVVHAIR